jgi:hypothetical protein
VMNTTQKSDIKTFQRRCKSDFLQGSLRFIVEKCTLFEVS